jgi:hypothetical protein
MMKCSFDVWLLHPLQRLSKGGAGCSMSVQLSLLPKCDEDNQMVFSEPPPKYVHVWLFKPLEYSQMKSGACYVLESNERDKKVMSLARAAERVFQNIVDDWDVCCLSAVLIDS